MKKKDLQDLPYMLYADEKGRIYNHPFLRMVGFSGPNPAAVTKADLIRVPQYSKLFYIPECPPMGMDPSSGDIKTVKEVLVQGTMTKCHAVAAFLEPGFVRSLLPAADYARKSYVLPMWAYTSVGFRDDTYWAPAFRIEYNHKWDPRNYDDRELVPAIKEYEKRHFRGRLIDHLIQCATENHCFAAKNLFLNRWEAPLPISRTCNAACLGCLSLQPAHSCKASHERIAFRPSKEEIVALAVAHLNRAPEAIVSFGQGCEGEPLTEYRLMVDSIKSIRERTDAGTINLNTNGSWPDRINKLAKSGLDSIRISLNSARPDFYRRYYQPKGYLFEDVVASIVLSKEMGLYTMINYLVFPGITDQEEEIEALKRLINQTGINFIHFKNLDIDPMLYLEKMPQSASKAVGMKKMVNILREDHPDTELGYFNKPVR